MLDNGLSEEHVLHHLEHVRRIRHRLGDIGTISKAFVNDRRDVGELCNVGPRATRLEIAHRVEFARLCEQTRDFDDLGRLVTAPSAIVHTDLGAVARVRRKKKLFKKTQPNRESTRQTRSLTSNPSTGTRTTRHS